MHEIMKAEAYSPQQSFDAGAPSKLGLLQAIGNGTIVAPRGVPSDVPMMADTSAPAIVTAPERAHFDDTSLHFDSYYKVSGSSALSNGEINFSIATLNNNYPITDIVQIKLTPFYFPLVTNATGSPDYYWYRKVYMQIVELSPTQSVLSHNSKQFQFEFDVDGFSSAAVKLTPVNDTFYFQRPIQSLDSLTLRFTTDHDFLAIPLPQDTLSVVAIGGTNPAQFRTNVVDTTSALGPVGAPTAPGVAVYINGLSTSNVGINNAANTRSGVYVTNIDSTTVFTVGSLNFSALAVGDYPCTIRIPKNHIALTMRFTSARVYQTNFMDAIHV